MRGMRERLKEEKKKEGVMKFKIVKKFRMQ